MKRRRIKRLELKLAEMEKQIEDNRDYLDRHHKVIWGRLANLERHSPHKDLSRVDKGGFQTGSEKR